MEVILTHPLFLYLVFPLLSVGLGVAIKYVTRNDQFARFSQEDMAVGPDLVLSACLIYVVLTTNRAVSLIKSNNELLTVLSNTSVDTAKALALQQETQKLSNQLAVAGWLITLLLLGLWSISTVVRKRGWKSATEMNTIVGIAVPMAFGVIALIVVMVQATQ